MRLIADGRRATLIWRRLGCRSFTDSRLRRCKAVLERRELRNIESNKTFTHPETLLVSVLEEFGEISALGTKEARYKDGNKVFKGHLSYFYHVRLEEIFTDVADNEASNRLVWFRKAVEDFVRGWGFIASSFVGSHRNKRIRK